MTPTPEDHISRSDIARLAGVGRAAVSNWERRHQDFPRPILIEGDEFFDTQAIMTWLDGRVIPRNALREGEAPGLTYGARFRECQERPPTPSHTVNTPPREAEDRLWVAFDGLRSNLAPERFNLLVLALVYARARDEEGWAAVERRQMDASRWAVRALHTLADLGGPPMWRELPAGERGDRVLAEIARAVDQWVQKLGAVDTFQMILARLTEAQGNKATEFFTPASVTRALVDLMAPEAPLDVYDPACRAGELLAATASRVRERSGASSAHVDGNALDPESLPLARMNLDLHGVDARLDSRPVESLCAPGPAHRFRYVISNPPFNVRDWCVDNPDSEFWRYGPPPRHNANFAWLQRAIDLLAPEGRATVVMPNGAAFSENPRERAIRAGLVEDGCLEGLVSLPPNLFHTTAIGVTIWLLRHPLRRPQEIILIDATGMGRMTTRTRRVLADEEHQILAQIVEGWRHGRGTEGHDALAKIVQPEEVRLQNYNLNPRRYLVRPTGGATGGNQTVTALRQELDHLHSEALAADARVTELLGKLKW
ncbi:N-6 DNA methylase [Microbispora sp. H10885]|uniref:N-6 DNA methylase n=1 Tax=Microbispora sp. H10885 TaxID=2729110 RepID=UPI0016011295|nr:N-6 DNA methylase [Microbispora sp. H10885]